jgi:hypothetical protein
LLLEGQCYFFSGAGGAGGFTGVSGGFTGVSGGFTVGAGVSAFFSDGGVSIFFSVDGVSIFFSVGFGAVVAVGPQPTTNPQATAAVRANTFRRIVVSL